MPLFIKKPETVTEETNPKKTDNTDLKKGAENTKVTPMPYRRVLELTGQLKKKRDGQPRTSQLFDLVPADVPNTNDDPYFPPSMRRKPRG